MNKKEVFIKLEESLEGYSKHDLLRFIFDLWDTDKLIELLNHIKEETE